MTTRTQKTIDIFLDALNNGELMKGNCNYCAVGNICASVDKENRAIWSDLFFTSSDTGLPVFNTGSLGEQQRARELISKTGYTEKELMLIEYRFETNTNIHGLAYAFHSKEEVRQDQLKGLTAVVNLLLEWDESKEEVKEVFTDRAELIPIK